MHNHRCSTCTTTDAAQYSAGLIVLQEGADLLYDLQNRAEEQKPRAPLSLSRDRFLVLHLALGLSMWQIRGGSYLKFPSQGTVHSNGGRRPRSGSLKNSHCLSSSLQCPQCVTTAAGVCCITSAVCRASPCICLYDWHDSTQHRPHAGRW